jgi:trehalose-6-phosphate synthase
MNTPSEEIVLNICASFPNCIWDYCGQSSKRAVMMKFKEALDTARREAMEEERKACADVVLEYETDSWNRGMLERIAREIRERNNLNK